MKFIRNFIEKFEDIEPMDVVFACLVTTLVVTTAVLVVCGAAFILYVASVIALAFTGAGGVL